MSNQTGKKISIAVVLALLAFGAWFGGKGRLTGAASGGGCGGDQGGGAAVDLSALGAADAKSVQDVTEISKAPAPVAANIQLADDKGRVIKELESGGLTTIPALAEHYVEAGCFEPGSAIIAQLLGKVASGSTVPKPHRDVIASVLLEGAVFARQGATQNAAANRRVAQMGRGMQGMMDAIRRGDDAALHTNLGAGAANPSAEALAELCVGHSLAATQSLISAGLKAPGAFADRAFAMLEGLDAGSDLVPVMIDLIDATAPVDPAWGKKLQTLISEKRFGDDAKASACKGIVRRGVGAQAAQAGAAAPAATFDCTGFLEAQKLKTPDAPAPIPADPNQGADPIPNQPPAGGQPPAEMPAH